MSNASHPYEAQHFAASDGARSAAAAQASAAQAAPDAPIGPVSEAARRAGRRTSPAGGRAWNYALVALTAALLPPCIAIIGLNGPTDAPAEGGAQRTASAAGAAHLDAQDGDDREDARRHSQYGASQAGNFGQVAAGEADPPEPLDDVALSEATDDAADEVVEMPEILRETLDKTIAEQTALPTDADGSADAASRFGASDVEAHRLVLEPSSPPPPELAFANDQANADAPDGGANAPANDWLKLDEHGEPCEVRLADGTTLTLDTYGGTFQGFDSQPPLLGDDAERVFGAVLPWTGWGSLALDAKHRRIYWIETQLRKPASPENHIMRADLKGRKRQAVTDLSELLSDLPTPDPEHGKLYWYTPGRRDGSERAIYRGNLDGSNGKVIIAGLRDFRGFAIDAAGGNLYYFDAGHLIGTGLDGSDEHPLVDARGGTIAIDHDGGKLYWQNGPRHLRRANLDGSEIEDVVDVLDGHITTFALDHVAKKIYWVISTNIRRSNFDGSNVQDVLVGLVGNTERLVVDTKDSSLYWMATKNLGEGSFDVGLWRMQLRKPAVAKSKSGPPLVMGTVPNKQAARGKLTLEGANFTGATEVVFIDDSTGQPAKSVFKALSNSALSVTVPKMSSGCKHPVIIVQNKGGVTATFPRDARVVQHEAVDRFHPNDQFTYVLPARASISIDRGVVLVLAQATAAAKQYGKNTFFLKNNSVSDLRGAPDNLIYLEPSATLNHLDKLTKGSKVVRLPAIRPSFLENLFEYQQPE